MSKMKEKFTKLFEDLQNYGWAPFIYHPFIPLIVTETIRLPEKKCECGGEKANTTHSDWCPKFERYSK